MSSGPVDPYSLPPTLSVPEAGRLLGIGSTTARRLDREGLFPVQVLKLGHARRVPTAALLELLGVPPKAPDTPVSGLH